MKKLCKLLCLFLALLLLSACAPTSTPTKDAEITFTDSVGNEVTLSKKPTRVAVLFSSLADIWTLAGGEVAITVGESVERGICSAEVTLVDAGAGKTINSEALIASAPELVILSADIPAQMELIPLCRAANIPVAAFRVEAFADYLAMLKICTDLLERPDLYELHGTAQQQKIEALIADKPLDGMRFLFVRAGSTARSVKAKKSDEHFAAAMLTELGATNVADEVPLLLDSLSAEAVLAENPDLLYFTAMGDEEASLAFVTQMLTQAEWQALSAVQNGGYVFLPKASFHYKPNAAWAQAYEYLALGTNEKGA